VGILVLVEELGVFSGAVGVLVAQSAIEKLKSVAAGAKYHAAKIRRESAVLIVQPYQDESPAFHQSGNRLKTQKGIAGVMQNAVAYHKIDTFGAEYRPKQIHLKEGDVLDLIGAPKMFTRFEGI